MIDTEELMRRVVHNAKPHDHDSPRWVVIRDLFEVGSTYASQICRKYGEDPDEIVKKPKIVRE